MPTDTSEHVFDEVDGSGDEDEDDDDLLLNIEPANRRSIDNKKNPPPALPVNITPITLIKTLINPLLLCGIKCELCCTTTNQTVRKSDKLSSPSSSSWKSSPSPSRWSKSRSSPSKPPPSQPSPSQPSSSTWK